MGPHIQQFLPNIHPAVSELLDDILLDLEVIRINNYDEFANYIEESHINKEVFNGVEACERIYSGYPGFVTATSKIYKKELVKEILFPVGRIHEDNFTSYKHFLKCEKIVYVNKKLYGYLIRENSITKSKFTKKNFDKYDAFMEEANYYKNAGMKNALIGSLKLFMYALSTDYTKIHDKKLKAKMRAVQKRAILFIKDNRELFNEEDFDWLLAPHLNNKLKDIYWKKIALRNRIKNISNIFFKVFIYELCILLTELFMMLYHLQTIL